MSNLYFKIFKSLSCQEERPGQSAGKDAPFIAPCTGLLLTLPYTCEKYLMLKKLALFPPKLNFRALWRSSDWTWDSFWTVNISLGGRASKKRLSLGDNSPSFLCAWSAEVPWGGLGRSLGMSFCICGDEGLCQSKQKSSRAAETFSLV